MLCVPINSLDDPRIADYRDLPRSDLRRGSGRFVAEGEMLVERLLASDYPVASVLVEARRAERIAAQVPEPIPVYVVPTELIEPLVGFRFHRGVLACGCRLPAGTLESVLPADAERLTIVVCPDVQDPENLGGILRNSAAFGVDAVVLGPRCADPFSRRVLRVSMGAVFKLPFVLSGDLLDDLRRLRERWQVELAASVLAEAGEVLEHATRPARFGLLFGSEARGLDEACITACQRRVTIPMRLETDSLNVSVAAGIFLYHFTRPGVFTAEP